MLKHRRPPQFSLQTMFGMTAVVALMLGMWSWRREYGLWQFFVGTGVCLVAIGILRRRVRLILVGIFVLVGIEVALRVSAEHTTINTGSGWCNRRVVVKVIDAATDKPIRGANVRILSGRNAGNAQWFATAENGLADVRCEFAVIDERYGTLFGTWGTRWISFRSTWAEVDAEGYQSVRVDMQTHLNGRWEVEADLPKVIVKIHGRERSP